MAITTRTDLGEVRISKKIIADMISSILSDPELSGRIWPATEHGHAIGKRTKIAEIVDLRDSDFASNIEADTDQAGDVTVEFSVIVRFGESIRALTRTIADRIAETMQYTLGIKPAVIIINIAGVKSKQIARRNTRTIYKYAPI